MTSLAYGQPWQVQIYRDSYTEYQLHNRNFYVQDSYSRQRLTVNVGFRFDYQTDESRAGQGARLCPLWARPRSTVR